MVFYLLASLVKNTGTNKILYSLEPPSKKGKITKQKFKKLSKLHLKKKIKKMYNTTKEKHMKAEKYPPIYNSLEDF